MSKVITVATTIVAMFCASASYGQAQNAGYSPQQDAVFQQSQYQSSFNPRLGSPAPGTGKMLVACRAEVPSNNTTYFSATSEAPSVSNARKEFRELVATQYGAVSQVQCVGKFNPAVVQDTVQQWQDKARATNNAIVNTDWQPTAASDQGSHSDNGRMARAGARVACGNGVVNSSAPCSSLHEVLTPSSNTAAGNPGELSNPGQFSFQR